MNDALLAVDIREAARRLSLSPRSVAALIARRELMSRKIGRRRIIPVDALEAFIRTDPAITNLARDKEERVPNGRVHQGE